MRKIATHAFTAVVLFWTILPAALAELTIIHAGTLLAIPGEPLKTAQSILVQESRIIEIMDGYVTASDLNSDEEVKTVINLKDAFVLPGLIDMHVHLTMEYQSKYHYSYAPVAIPEADMAVIGVMNAHTTLMAGITTVRDLWASGRSIYAVRDAVNADRVPGPRIFASGEAISATGGHGDYIWPQEDVLDAIRPDTLCDDAAACTAAVRREIHQGADVIKVMATGGGADENGKAGSAPEMTIAELTSVVEAAKALDRKVAAHAHGAAGIKAALTAGVDSIEHGTYVDAEGIKLFRKSGAYLVPTLSLLTRVEARYDQMSPDMQEKMKAFTTLMEPNHQRAFEKGVKFAMGSDAGVKPHGTGAEELVRYVKIGMTPEQAIMTGTINAADLLGKAEELGRIAPGAYADIIAVRENPLEDVSRLLAVPFVMKDGKVYKNED